MTEKPLNRYPNSILTSARILYLAIFHLCLTFMLYAAPGDPDPSFGNGGIAASSFGSSPNSVLAVAVQPDGKSVIAGVTGDPYDFVVARFNIDGSFDSTFGDGGKIVTQVGTGYDSATSVVIQPDGKIIVAGHYETGFQLGNTVLFRYNSNGSPDTSFGTGGKVTTDIAGRYAELYGMALQTDGKIVVSGYTTVNNVTFNDGFLVRYNSDGSLDSSFGGAGKVIFDYNNREDSFRKLAIQSDGKIIAGGNTWDSLQGPVGRSLVVRFNPDGAVDSSFGNNGIISTGYDNKSTDARAVAILTNGKILVGGTLYYNNGTGFIFDSVLFRYNTDGSLDTSFGDGGFMIIHNPRGNNRLSALAIQSNGKIITAGSSNGPNGSLDFTIMRFNASGSLDRIFGNNGIVTTDILGSETAFAVAFQSDGKIMAGGATSNSIQSSFALVRYLSFSSNLLQSPNFTFSDSTGNNNGFAEPGESLVLNIPLTNATENLDATGTTLQVAGGGSVGYATIPNDSTVTRQISFTVPANSVCGSALNLTFNVNSSLGPVSFTRQLIIGAPVTTLSENFDSVTAPVIPANWTATSVQGGINFVTSTFSSNGAPNSAFAADPTTVGGGTDLTSPTVPITSALSQISFYHSFRTEAQWDGGVLEISIGGGVFQDIVAAGGVFLEGGYNGSLDPLGANNPLAGRPAWTGNSFGYIKTSVRLPASAIGQNVQFRWRFGADNNTAGPGTNPGWYIDNIAVIGSFNCSTVNTRKSPFDFDGDGKTDIGIFRPSDGSWWYTRSSSTDFRVYAFGLGSDIITPGDFTGDGKTDIAIFRPSSGEWYIQRSEDNSYFSFPFGASGDIPTPSDFDGDGKTDAAVFRPSAGTWYILNSGGSGTSIVSFGSSEDKPVPADFDGDGRADIAIFRPSDGSWWYLRSSDSQFRVFRFGLGTDKPVQGDYTGDGKADLAVFRPQSGEWFVRRSEDNSYFSVPFGANGDIPSPGDYDGDGIFDTAVFRPETANWFVQRSSAGILILSFGTASDRPIPNAFVP